MPVGEEPRVEVEAHRGPTPVRGPERLRANPAQPLEALERTLNDPGLRQPGPLLAVHLARGGGWRGALTRILPSRAV